MHVTLTQNLLPFLWRSGVLGGRTFDVLMTRLPLALVPHPLGGIHDEEVMKKADLAIDAVLAAVTRS